MKASVTRNSVGIYNVNDVPDGEYSIEELSRLNQAQTDALNSANERDQADGFAGEGSPSYGDAFEREPRPTAVDGNSKSDRYGR